MKLFSILGPVMIGPSSSHTAGAARIGLMARRMLGEPVISARVGLHGSFAATWKGHGTDRAIVGGLMGMAVDDERLRDSLALANAAGMRAVFEPVTLKNAHPNTVRIRAEGARNRVELVASSVGGGSIRVTALDGLEISLDGAADTLIVRHRDAPGAIAAVSAELAAHGINIATMRVARRQAGGYAIMAIELDAAPGEAVLAALNALPCVDRVSLLPKEGL
ncbi:MAG: L-serine ammonia-lyase, iron-sulfur-dependent, subunit beta [Clostridiales bacterium]|nr:L-serine ammonia-lyase, iron-sulfur-dependent, subunit beta [Clostridiales bacterium]